ncbi:hypothetical protein B0H10DRAFT_1975132 [Mycena sp. CBHHK59/15]|nr:hypothetical protein B0H10DRAFT_1975132 [Mycena sp. CBHHK59/15]
MDAASLRRFHSSTISWPSDPFFIPSGGLARFLHETLHFQVFLVSLVLAAQVRQNELRRLFSRYNTPMEAAWMFHVLLVPKGGGFDGDNDGPPERGCTPIQVAAAEIEFLLQQCADTFMMHRSTDRTTFLITRSMIACTIEGYFMVVRLQKYTRIKIGSPSVPEFDPARRSEYWLEVEWVVEATLISLSQIKGNVRVETRGLSPSLFTDVEGPAIGIRVPVLEAVELEGAECRQFRRGAMYILMPGTNAMWKKIPQSEKPRRLASSCSGPYVCCHNIVLPNSFRAEYNLHWDRESAREEAIPVDGRAFRMMEILEYLVFVMESQHLLTTVTRLRAVASASVTITEAQTGILQREYDEFRSSGEPYPPVLEYLSDPAKRKHYKEKERERAAVIQSHSRPFEQMSSPYFQLDSRPRTIPQLLELLERVQVPELEISQGAEWKPIIPISEILRRVVHSCDLLVCSPMTYARYRKADKIVRADLIAHQQPSGPCYQEIWHQTSSCQAIPVSDLCWQMLGLTNYFVMCCGFEGEETPSGTRLFNSLQKLRKVSKMWWMVHGITS